MGHVEQEQALIEEIARGAGKLVRPFSGKNRGRLETGRGKHDIEDPADQLANRYIVERLLDSNPSAWILSEEGFLEGSDDRGYIVDPIDGTGAFSRGEPYWGQSIAYVEGDTVRAAVVGFPACQQMFRLGKESPALPEPQDLSGLVAAGDTYSDAQTEETRMRAERWNQALTRLRNVHDWRPDQDVGPGTVDWVASRRWSATYELLRTLNPEDPAHVHVHPALMFAWDIAASGPIAQAAGLSVVNLASGQELDVYADFGVGQDPAKMNGHIPTITGHPSTVERFLDAA